MTDRVSRTRQCTSRGDGVWRTSIQGGGRDLGLWRERMLERAGGGRLRD